MKSAAPQPANDAAPRQSAPRGRPRDPDLESKVFAVALRLYGEQGWEGFNFEVIARAAGVGKNALYRRWPTKGALLREMLKSCWVDVDRIDCGTLHQDLVALCAMLFRHLAGPMGPVGLQLQLDLVRHEVVAEAMAQYRADVRRSARAIILRGIERGEIPAATDPILVLDVIAGAVINHVSATPEPLREEMLQRSAAYARQLVDLVHRGLTAA